jgi:hypothetical protein
MPTNEDRGAGVRETVRSSVRNCARETVAEPDKANTWPAALTIVPDTAVAERTNETYAAL